MRIIITVGESRLQNLPLSPASSAPLSPASFPVDPGGSNSGISRRHDAAHNVLQRYVKLVMSNPESLLQLTRKSNEYNLTPKKNQKTIRVRDSRQLENRGLAI